MIIKLVRHGESEANANGWDGPNTADWSIPLTHVGFAQAQQAGKTLGKEFVANSLAYRSPYVRTRQTLDYIGVGADVYVPSLSIYEDPRLREVDHGYEHADDQQDLRETHGKFYYRWRGGESPADCYDRTSTFLESMMRQVQRKNASKVLIVSHGITIRCFVMRFLHLSVEQYETMANPRNCDIVTIAPLWRLDNAVFTSGRWGVEGIRLRDGVDDEYRRT